MAQGVLANIPRLEPVSEILAFLGPARSPSHDSGRESPSPIPRDAQLVQLALEFERLEAGTASLPQALAKLGERRAAYAADLFQAFVDSRLCPEGGEEETLLPIDALVLGMVLAQDVVTNRDRLLIARGHEVTESVLRSLQSFSRRGELIGPIRVLRVAARQRRAS
jgi:hypothetical protein